MKTVQPIQFGKFLLLEPLGSSRSVEGFRAVDLSRMVFEGFVLLKRVHLPLANDLRANKILVYEAKVTKELNHPGITKIQEAGKVKDKLYMTQEHPWGRNLLAVLRQCRELRRKVEPEVVTYIAIQLCRALDYAHTRKLSFGTKRFVVHRNINLKNIWVSFEGHIQLCEFGTEPVNLTGPDAANLDFRAICALSPEQVNQSYYDHRTDLFSLGTILYELLCGVHPFRGKDLHSVKKNILHGSVEPVATHASVPPELEKIVLKCLSRNIENRYPRAGTMLLQLETLQSSFRSPISQDAFGNWMKNLFQREIFLEIRGLHEAFSQCLGPGSLVLRGIPAYLFARSQPKKLEEDSHASTAPAVKTRAIMELEEETRVLLEQDSAITDSCETIVISDHPDRETGTLSVDEERSLVDNYEPPDAHLEDETILLDEMNPPLPGHSRPEPPKPVRHPTLPPFKAPAVVSRPPATARPSAAPMASTPSPYPLPGGGFATGPHQKISPGQILSPPPPARIPVQKPKSPLARLSSMSSADLRVIIVSLIFLIVALLVLLVFLAE